MRDHPRTERPFLWGAATSSHQIEGGNDRNDWWAWEAQGRIEGGARSGAATDHWNRFREDIRLAADLGLNAYRFSVEWSRLEPERGRWDSGAFDWYQELIAECSRRGLEPMLTLHHFTSPLWLVEKGGLAWDEMPGCFAEYVRRAAAAFGKRGVRLWCTINEPMVLIVGSYLGQFMPPAIHSPNQASIACHNLLKAHVLAYDILHGELGAEIEVGIAQNVLDFLPDRAWHPFELALARVFHRFYNRAWLDAVTGKKQRFGVTGLVPPARPVREALGRRTVDFIGINYYTKAYVQWRPRDASDVRPGDLPIGLSFARRKERASDLGWAIHPEGFRKMLRMASRYGLPVYVTENGIADREDSMRPQYLLSHLDQVALAISKGQDIRGYFHWSLLDNFEWVKGFGPRFGLYRVNYETFERTPTGSAELYRKIIEAHRGRERMLPDSSYFCYNRQ